MKNKFWLVCCLALIMLTAGTPAWAVDKQEFANGMSAVMKVGIVVMVVMLVAVTAIFAYGMFINRNK